MKPNTKLASWNDLLHPGEATDFFQRREFLPFEPFEDDYRKTNALWLAELSRLAYSDEPLKWFHGTGKFFSVPETDTQAVLFKFDHFAVLAFRGTEQKFKDLKTDIDFRMIWIAVNKYNDQINVHEGFYKAFISIWASIKKELDKLDCPVFYTGHSLGGALATLAAYELPPKALYTFGSPRVGDKNFAMAVCDKVEHYRIVDDIDIVPDLPPFELGYRHCGPTTIILGSFPVSFWDRLTSILKPPKHLADHAPINYVDRI